MEQIGIKEKNPIKRLAIALLLWLVSLLLKYIIAMISFVFTPIYYIITFKWRSGILKLSDWFYNMALSNDQSGNVTNATTFQFIFTKPGGETFGNADDTVSYVLARNKYQGRLTFFGRLLVGILDAIDYSAGGHIYKAIGMKRNSDYEASIRFKEDDYYN